MPGLFPRWSDVALRITLALLAAMAFGIPLALMLYVRTPFNDDRNLVAEQPVQFDHRHHVQDDGIDCLYCHTDAERAASAGVPATEVCMGCHSQVWNQSQLLEPVRASYYTGRSIPWNRVHDLPDFVHFDHSVHVTAGVVCAQCHGDVDRMALPHKVQALTMGFCLDCHRHPDRRISGYTPLPGASRSAPRAGFVDNTLTSCTACHR
ncbi:MAG TPA: cytochrome c3 family protein [Polyangiales bacterium]|nr:cytochrome c3 family protein [Polyangiales bacterium]